MLVKTLVFVKNLSKLTKCCKLQHFCGLTSFAGAMQKRSKCCTYKYFFRLEMHKTLQIPAFLKTKKKKHCKLQHVWQVDRKKCWYLFHRDLRFTPQQSPPKIISNIALFRSFLPKRPILEENALFRAYFQCLNGGSNMIEIRHNNPYFHQCTWLK